MKSWIKYRNEDFFARDSIRVESFKTRDIFKRLPLEKWLLLSGLLPPTNPIRMMENGHIIGFTDNELLLQLDIAYQISSAVRYYHKFPIDGSTIHSIIHRDLKPENILFNGYNGRTNRPIFLVSDFGIAAISSEDREMTPLDARQTYLAPELIQTDYTPASDIYSLGIILFELFYPIRTGEKLRDLIENIQEGENVLIHLNQSLPSIAQLIKSMMSLDPNLRPNIDNIVSSLDLELRRKGDTSFRWLLMRIHRKGDPKLRISQCIVKFDDTVLNSKWTMHKHLNIYPKVLWFKGQIMNDSDLLTSYNGIEYEDLDYEPGEPPEPTIYDFESMVAGLTLPID